MKAASDADLTRRFGAIMDDALLIAETRGATFPKGVKNQLRLGFSEVATERCRVEVTIVEQLLNGCAGRIGAAADLPAERKAWELDVEMCFVAALKRMLEVAIQKGARFPRAVRTGIAKRWGRNAAEICFGAVDTARKLTREFAEDLPDALLTSVQGENECDGG